jgi:hypothetical protein
VLYSPRHTNVRRAVNKNVQPSAYITQPAKYGAHCATGVSNMQDATHVCCMLHVACCMLHVADRLRADLVADDLRGLSAQSQVGPLYSESRMLPICANSIGADQHACTVGHLRAAGHCWVRYITSVLCRGKALGSAVFVNFGSNLLVSLTFLTLAKAIPKNGTSVTEPCFPACHNFA